MRKLCLSCAYTLLTSLAFLVPVKAQTIPPVNSMALDDSAIILPDPSNQKPLILVIGFSRKSGEVCVPWGKRLAADFQGDSRIAYYQIPVLEGAPSMIRPMIVRGMRKNTEPTQLAHMVPIYNHEDDWKKAVAFSNPDDAYIVLADAHGVAIWQTHGAFTDSAYSELKSTLSRLRAKSTSSAPAANH
jgi:hypothetical protein